MSEDAWAGWPEDTTVADVVRAIGGVSVEPQAKWALDQLSAMRRGGASSHDLCHEFNRLVYGQASCPDCEPA